MLGLSSLPLRVPRSYNEVTKISIARFAEKIKRFVDKTYMQVYTLLKDRRMSRMKFNKMISALLAAVVLMCGCSSDAEQPVFNSERHTIELAEFMGDDINTPATAADEFLYHYDNLLEGIVITNYFGNADTVSVPAEIDGQPVIKVDLRCCYKNIGTLLLPDSLQDVRLAKYDDIIAHHKNENYTHDWQLSYYYVSELGGCVVNDYYGTDTKVRIPEELPDPDRRSEKWTVKKITLGSCEKEIQLLIVPDDVEHIYAEQYDDVLIAAGELHEQIDKNIVSDKLLYTGIGVERMNIPASLFQDRRITFSNTTLTEVFIPESVTCLADGIFMDCFLLERAVCNSEEITVGAHAFFGCERLRDIDVSKAVSIGDWAFSRCVSLVDVQLSDRLTYIGNGAFMRCGCGTLQLPASVQHIGEDVFGNDTAPSV